MIELNDSEIGLCFSFSYKVSQRTEKYYKVRNIYASTEKIIFDCFIGKLAEIAVFKHMQGKGHLSTYPSFKPQFCASDDVDIRVFKDSKEIRVHCKAVRYDSPVKDSWLIQKKEIKSLGENDYFALCKFHSPSEIEIMKIVHHSKITWREPMNKKLASKSACYLSDF